MSETKKESEAPVELTEEQIKEQEVALKKQKAELMTFYKGELPLLKLQADYEEHITRIEIAKMQRLEIMMAKAQMMAPPPEGEDGKGPQRPPRQERAPEHDVPMEERKLKTE